jgi:uncharacterized protein YjiS (DUF1127 family)
MLVQSRAQPAAAGKEHQPHLIAAFLRRLVARIRAYLKHRRDRQQLFEYLASDHRAAADLGVNADTSREWSRRPFWRA